MPAQYISRTSSHTTYLMGVICACETVIGMRQGIQEAQQKQFETDTAGSEDGATGATETESAVVSD